MDLFGVLNLDEVSHGLAGLSMFPYFDTAHYTVSVMALREQPGKQRTFNNRLYWTGLAHHKCSNFFLEPNIRAY